ncbi:hypothetical protein [Burkholderia ambifaria]|uniref:hypothetical protein n=1 Tax=Burkholderia ambifaria TaxID=152480 RepID=UPI00158CC7BB|nr:hypothetical protein [Burkholderia ambifaria]
MWFLAGRMMKAAALVVVVVTATASNSYAEPAPASDASAKVPCSQHSAQRKYVYQPHTSWKSYLGFTEELDSIIARLICSKEGEEAAKMISRPKNTVGLVGNLKVIFDGDILLQNKFYTAENLKDIFNLEEVAVFDDRDGAERHISISGGRFRFGLSENTDVRTLWRIDARCWIWGRENDSSIRCGRGSHKLWNLQGWSGFRGDLENILEEICSCSAAAISPRWPRCADGTSWKPDIAVPAGRRSNREGNYSWIQSEC